MEKFIKAFRQSLKEVDAAVSPWELFYQLITVELLKQKGLAETESFFADEQLCKEFPQLFDTPLCCPKFPARAVLDQLSMPLKEESLGRLHQLFQSEDKIPVSRKNKIHPESVASATQLFTPHWIIEYLVQNSCGRCWMNRHPKSDLYRQWPCYAESDPLLQQTDLYDITIMDPAMGCGHMLLEAFDFMMKLYTAEQRDRKEAALHFLLEQCHGIDIDPKAVRIGRTALLIKAADYVPGILKEPLDLNIVHCQGTEENTASLTGSLCPEELADHQDQPLFSAMLEKQYDIVITNPPYMGSQHMSAPLKQFLKKYYPDSKLDLYAAFIERSMAMTRDNGYTAMLTQQSWMFLSGYHRLREKIMQNTLVAMAHLGPRAFEEICGEVVQTTAFVLHKHNDPGYHGVYDRLVEPSSSQAKYQLFLQKTARITACQKDYSRIPGSPVAYWATEQEIRTFHQPTLAEISLSPGQNVTGNNRKYLRKHWELDKAEIGQGQRWIFYAKGGGYRKWWGNLENVIDWSPEAREEYRQRKGSTASQIIKPCYWYKKGITWGLIASEQPSFRVMPEQATFDKGGSTILVQPPYFNTALACSNSKITQHLSRMMNPTLSFQLKDVLRMPVTLEYVRQLDQLAEHCISLSKADWDSFETSFEFDTHPMIDHAQSLRISYRNWQKQCEERFFDLKQTEEQINQLLIETYQLDMDPCIQLKDVTVHRIFDQRSFIPDNMKISPYALTGKQAVKSFISYGICCLFRTADHLPVSQLPQRFIQWLDELYGPQAQADNLEFITEMIANQETEPEACLKRYFETEFYKDHVSRFQKRPVYWMFDSGKEHAFQILADMKQLTPELFNTIRNQLLPRKISYFRYLNETQPSARHHNQLQEILSYHNRIMKLEPTDLDLDDGVAGNMKKLQTDREGQLQQIFALSEKIIK